MIKPLRSRIWPRDNGHLVLAASAVAGAFLACTSILWQAFNAAPIELNDHCGYDGLSWCRMALWHAGDRPYQQRFFLPLLVGITHPSLGDAWNRFLILSIISTIGLIVGVAALTGWVAVRIGAPVGRSRWAAILAASLMALAFYTWHYSLMIPVNTDVPSAALGLGWLLLLIGDHPRRIWATVPLAFITQATRDNYAPVLLLTLLVLFVLVKPRRWLAVANAGAVLLAIVISLRVHFVPTSPAVPLLPLFHQTLVAHFTSVHGFLIYLWLVTFGLGVVSLFALPTLRYVRRDPAFTVMWAFVVGSVGLATIEGGTTDRYLLPALMVLLGLGMGWIATRHTVADIALIVAIAVTLGVWQPWFIISGRVVAILRATNQYVEPWHVNGPRLAKDLHRVAFAAIIGVVLGVCALLVSRKLGTVRGEVKSDSLSQDV